MTGCATKSTESARTSSSRDKKWIDTVDEVICVHSEGASRLPTSNIETPKHM